MQTQYSPPTGYLIQNKIIQTSNHSIPICRLKPKIKTNNNIIIYSHGNASDMADSLTFIQRLAQHIHTEYIIYDYTGYGESRVGDVGQEIICKDLEIVLAWLTEGDIQGKCQGGGQKKYQGKQKKQIILWGFSLGTFPVITTASKYTVGAVVLQCPIASVSSLFYAQLHPDMKFKEDHFANIDSICDINKKTKILIMHSSADQIIPFSHAKILYTKYMNKNGEDNIQFIQIGKIKHNSLHKYIVSTIQNQLQKEVFGFLIKIIFKHNDSISSMKTEKSIKSFISAKPTNIYEPNHINSTNQRRLTLQQSQLKSLAMKIVEADIAQITGDMQELIVEQQTQTIKKKLIQGKLDKKCFCFPHQV